MSSTPPPEIPPGYKPGDYIPFKDRDPNNPTPIAGQPAWTDPATQVQQSGRLSPQEHYRAIYGQDAAMPTFYASWGRRVLGYLVDGLISVIVSVPLVVGYVQLVGSIDYETDSFGNKSVASTTDVSNATIALIVVGAVISMVFNIYNLIIRQGRTGYSLGKTVLGIKLVKISTGQPMGAGLCFVRQLAHYVDSLVCYLGWLWPLWDSRRQTLADKIMGTVVIIQPQERAG
jgi:uncharacterized RDD family membrane protein YckC